MRGGRRWQFYRTQTGYWGVGFNRWPFGWEIQLGPYNLGRTA